MGTKVQCKNYLQGYNFVRDLIEDANVGWSMYHDDRIQTGHPYNGSTLRLVNEHPEYDKEMLKRMMLEHEAIFRKQVYELHRLYRIQKNLMDEFRRKELHRFSVSSDMTQANLFVSHMPIPGTKKMWHMPCLPSANSNCIRAPVASSDNLICPLNARVPVDNGVTLWNSAHLEADLKISPSKKFDLQLPADVYIRCEIPEQSEKDNAAKSLFRASAPIETSAINLENDVRLTLGTGEDPSVRENNGKAYSHAQNCLSTLRLADLNEPAKDMTGSATTQTYHPGVCPEEIPGFTGIQKDVFEDRHKDKGTTSNSVHEDIEGTRQEWSLFKHESVQSGSSLNSYNLQVCSGKFPPSPEADEVKHKKIHGILLPDHQKRDICLREKPNNNNENFGRSLHVSNSDGLGVEAPYMSGSYFMPALSDASMTSAQVSCWTKTRNSISHIPFAVQALPCFNVCDKRHSTGDSKSTPRLGTEITSYQNGFHHDSLFSSNSASSRHHSSATCGKQSLHYDCDNLTFGQFQKCYKGLQCTDVKSVKDLNLNSTLPNGIGNGLTGQQELPTGISWLRKKPSSKDSIELEGPASKMQLGFSHGYCHLLSSFDAVSSECKGKQKEEEVLFPSKTQDISSNLLAKDSKMLKNEACDSSKSERILGIPILDHVQQNALSSPSISLQEQSSADEKTSFRNCFNLNSLIPCTEYPDKLVISSNCKAEVPFPPSRANASVRISPEIDLEAPILLQGEENVLYHKESTRVTHHVSCTEMLMSKSGSSQVAGGSHEALIREAAENIVAMSLDIRRHAGETICHPSSPAPCDSLHWFAEVTLDAACASNAREGGNSSFEASEDEGLDLFEFLTLKLKETNVDEYLCRQPEQECQKGDGKGATTLLLTKPWKDKVRKRRQRRDFQKDILPGLASLSRHEVTEDLQTIGGLFRTSGRYWQTSVTRRNVGRNRLQSPVKRTRRPRSLAVPVAEVHASPPVAPLIITEFKVDGRSVMGWGRTTRRCQRQRCPAGNISLPNLKV